MLLFATFLEETVHPAQTSYVMYLFLMIVAALAGIIVLLLIVGLFSKKKYAIERNITINKHRTIIYDYLRFLKNQEQYSKWVMADVNMKKSFRGTDAQPGFVYAWDSNDKQVGAGEQEIISFTENKRIDYQIRFTRPFPGVAQSYFLLESVGNDQTIVKWGFNSSMKYPMNIMMLFISVDKMLGDDLATSLKTLKSVFEEE